MTYDNPIDFIKLLKSQHKSIISTIYEIDDHADGFIDLNKSIEKLNKITDLLFDHLEKEDKQLYPTLRNHKETEEIGKKYYYDMERLSCIALDFFKRYCVNKEGLKIFAEDFINSYSIFKGLLKARIKREESELYPAFILLQSGVLHSEVLEYFQERKLRNQNGQKQLFIYGDNQHSLEALSLALEIAGYKVTSTHSRNHALNLLHNVKSDLVLFDMDKQDDKELSDLLMSVKTEAQGVKVIGYSTKESKQIKENLRNNLYDYIPKAAVDIEAFSEKIKQILGS